MSYIIEQVKRRRQERNWSQKYIADCINVSQSFIYKAVIYIFTLINVELFRSLFVFGIRVRGRGRFCRSSSFFFHWPAELASLRHHRPGVQKKQDDTRRSSNGPRTRIPSTYVITTWQAKPDLKTINFSEKRFSDKITQLSIIR